MRGYNCRRVRPAHIVSIGLGDILQFRERHSLDLDAQASVRLTSHSNRGIRAAGSGRASLAIAALLFNASLLSVGSTGRGRVAEGGMRCIASHAWASSSILYDSEQRSIGRMIACDIGLLEPSVQPEVDIAVKSTHTYRRLKSTDQWPAGVIRGLVK
jgi:hypothetical protein